MNERMDERIQTLAEQAKQYAREQMAHPMDPNLFSAAVFQSKFAELIIREAIWIAYHSHALSKDAKFTDHLDAVKEHFGVE